MFATYGYGQLLEFKSSVLKHAENTRADVLLLEHQGEQAILKDYTQSSKGFSFLVAPFLVYREVKALKKLGDLEGVPQLFKKVSSRAFLMEYIPSQRIRLVKEQIDWPEFVAKTENLVGKLHQRGVIHGDLRNATNIMVDENRNPVFVDFVSAVHRGHNFNLFGLILFKLCIVIDHGALFKLKSKYAPDLIAQSEQDHYQNQGVIEITARWISTRIRNFIQNIFP